jgi:amino-acid N-acetyltransferase
VENFSIQPATKEHQSAIKTLINDAGINPMGLKWQRFLVALDENEQVIGCGQVKPHRDGSHELASIAVIHGWRRQGIASAIINELVKQASQSLWLTCMSHLIPFYEPFGFIEMKDRKQMPAYFRRVLWIFPVFARFSSAKGYLAVMVKHVG